MKVIVHDIANGTPTTRDATPAEVAQATSDAAAASSTQAAIADAATRRANDLAAVQAKAATDPAFAALYRLLGGR